ncbi:MAG: HAD-IA family hydrolase, partial [Rhodothermales bacterium]
MRNISTAPLTNKPYLMALDACIFDLDGTLLDTNRLHARAFEQAFAEQGFRIPEDRILPEIGKGAKKLIPAIVGPSAEAEYGERLREGHSRFYAELIEQEDVRVFPDVRDLLTSVRDRGLKVAVATASKEEELNKVAERAGLDLDTIADVIVTDTDVEESKPAPDTVQAAVKKLGLAPTQCVMLGDTPYDAEACKQAGVVLLAVATGVHSGEDLLCAGARAVYADAADVLNHLDGALEIASPGPHHLDAQAIDTLMQAALDEARSGMEAGEVPIGSVLARFSGEIVARGHNRAKATGNATAHAEMEAFQAAERLGEIRDLVLVTTLEPCVMCFGAAMMAGVDTILYGLEAPSNGGVERCQPILTPGARMPRVVGGLRRAQ